jgi:hypothetical protein
VAGVVAGVVHKHIDGTEALADIRYSPPQVVGIREVAALEVRCRLASLMHLSCECFASILLDIQEDDACVLL